MIWSSAFKNSQSIYEKKLLELVREFSNVTMPTYRNQLCFYMQARNN